MQLSQARWRPYQAVLVVAAITAIWGATRSVGAESNRPNVVLLLADDLGYGELSCQGGDIPTPAIDALAASGVRCTAGYVTASYCSPSRAGLLAGRLQTRFGHENNPTGAANCDPSIGLPIGELTLADRLREQGYATSLIGKWHLGGTPEFHPLRRGFDEFFGFLHEGHTYAPAGGDELVTWLRRRTLPGGGDGRWRNANGSLWLSTHMQHNEPPYDADNPVLRGSQPVDEPLYFTDAITREARAFIRRNRQRPFFLMASYSAVHSPMQALRSDVQQFASIDDVHRRIFAGMLHRLDQSVGGIMAELKEQRLLDRTLIVFLSDNGGPTKELTSSNRPLRGGKGNLYEGGIRVPFIFHWPGGLPSGEVYDHPVLACDIAATALASTGADIAPAATDGVNLLPRLAGEDESNPHDELYWRMGRRGALRSGRWKLILTGDPNNRRRELYDIDADLQESRDLADREPDIASSLEHHWRRIDAEMVDPLW